MGDLRLREGKNQRIPSQQVSSAQVRFQSFPKPMRVVDFGRFCVGEGKEKKPELYL